MMDINKRKKFESEFMKTDYFNIEYRAKGISKPFSWNDQANRYVWHDIQAGWEMWEKAQAVPEWIDVSDRLPEEGEEVFVHHYGHIVQATRDKKYSGGFKQRNCYGWESVSSYISHWMPKSIELPEPYHFYYENDAKQKAMIEAQEPGT